MVVVVVAVVAVLLLVVVDGSFKVSRAIVSRAIVSSLTPRTHRLTYLLTHLLTD